MKHKNVKPIIKNSPSVGEILLKTYKIESICYHHLVKKPYQTFVIKSNSLVWKRHQHENFHYKKSQT